MKFSFTGLLAALVATATPAKIVNKQIAVSPRPYGVPAYNPPAYGGSPSGYATTTSPIYPTASSSPAGSTKDSPVAMANSTPVPGSTGFTSSFSSLSRTGTGSGPILTIRTAPGHLSITGPFTSTIKPCLTVCTESCSLPHFTHTITSTEGSPVSAGSSSTPWLGNSTTTSFVGPSGTRHLVLTVTLMTTVAQNTTVFLVLTSSTTSARFPVSSLPRTGTGFASLTSAGSSPVSSSVRESEYTITETFINTTRTYTLTGPWTFLTPSGSSTALDSPVIATLSSVAFPTGYSPKTYGGFSATLPGAGYSSSSSSSTDNSPIIATFTRPTCSSSSASASIGFNSSRPRTATGFSTSTPATASHYFPHTYGTGISTGASSTQNSPVAASSGTSVPSSRFVTSHKPSSESSSGRALPYGPSSSEYAGPSAYGAYYGGGGWKGIWSGRRGEWIDE